jgi:hypothetical protein
MNEAVGPILIFISLWCFFGRPMISDNQEHCIRKAVSDSNTFDSQQLYLARDGNGLKWSTDGAQALKFESRHKAKQFYRDLPKVLKKKAEVSIW